MYLYKDDGTKELLLTLLETFDKICETKTGMRESPMIFGITKMLQDYYDLLEELTGEEVVQE